MQKRSLQGPRSGRQRRACALRARTAWHNGADCEGNNGPTPAFGLRMEAREGADRQQGGLHAQRDSLTAKPEPPHTAPRAAAPTNADGTGTGTGTAERSRQRATECNGASATACASGQAQTTERSAEARAGATLRGAV